MKLSYVILTANRKDELRRCLQSILAQDRPPDEIVVVDNGSTDGTPAMLATDFPMCRVVALSTNTGVCAGRNAGLRAATGDVLVTIDDDCILEQHDFNRRLLERFATRPRMGVLALNVATPYNPAAPDPFPSLDKRLRNSEAEVSYFLGGAVAFRKEIFQQVGYYPEEYFYAMEELDLSYRLMETNWQIWFAPDLIVTHLESPRERPPWRRIYFDYRNRIWLGVKYLPLPYLVVNLSVWGLVFFLRAVRYGYIMHFLRSIRDGVWGAGRYWRNRRQTVLSPRAVQRIKRLKGRLLY